MITTIFTVLTMMTVVSYALGHFYGSRRNKDEKIKLQYMTEYADKASARISDLEKENEILRNQVRDLTQTNVDPTNPQRIPSPSSNSKPRRKRSKKNQ